MSKKGVLGFSISCLVPKIFKFLCYYQYCVTFVLLRILCYICVITNIVVHLCYYQYCVTS